MSDQENGARKLLSHDLSRPNNRADSDSYRIEAMDSAALDREKFDRDWLINQILALGQPGVIGGPKKAAKTSILVDMAVSVGTGTPFLGHFTVPKRCRVAVFCGESDWATLQDIARRVCAARGVSLDCCLVRWSVRLPRIADQSHCEALGHFLAQNKIKLILLDPLYLCLLGGHQPVSATNLYEVGPLLLRIAQTCLDAGATPILVHHVTKTAASKQEPIELGDLAFAGIGEFARQWVLISRLKPFDPSTGRHDLLLAAGGSAGHSGSWGVTIREGRMNDDFGGRKWDVSVADAPDLDEHTRAKDQKSAT